MKHAWSGIDDLLRYKNASKLAREEGHIFKVENGKELFTLQRRRQMQGKELCDENIRSALSFHVP
jgi:hypothetical protein